MTATSHFHNRGSVMRQQGLTLIELMVTLVVAVILITAAVPSFVTLVRNNRLTTQSMNFVDALNLARSEAVKRGTRVTVCKRVADPDVINCANGAAGRNWANGWIVFVDNNDNAALDNGEETLLVADALHETLTLETANNLVGDYASFIRIGFPRTVGGGVQNGNFNLCDARGDAFRRVIGLNASGRVRARQDAGAC